MDGLRFRQLKSPKRHKHVAVVCSGSNKSAAGCVRHNRANHFKDTLLGTCCAGTSQTRHGEGNPSHAGFIVGSGGAFRHCRNHGLCSLRRPFGVCTPQRCLHAAATAL